MGLSREITEDDVRKYYVTRLGYVIEIIEAPTTPVISSALTVYGNDTADGATMTFTWGGCYYGPSSKSAHDLIEGPFVELHEAEAVAALIREE